MSQHNGARVGRLASAFLWLILPTSAANDDIISTQEPGMDRRSQARPQAPAEAPRVRQGGGTTDVPVQPTFSQRLVAFTTPGLRSERPLALRGIAADKLRRRQMMGFLVSCHI